MKQLFCRQPVVRAAQRGFTLIELLIVMAIIGLLAALVAPKVMGHLDKAKVDSTTAQLTKIQTSMDMFRLDFGRYPTAEEGLSILWTKPDKKELAAKWKRDGYLGKKPQDGWKHDFEYKVPGPNSKDYDVISLGADGKTGGEGADADISIWD